MSVEFYRHSYRDSVLQDMLDKYKASNEENRRCIKYIEDEKTGLYANAYKDYVVDSDNAYTKALIKEFGMERVRFIIANTIRNHMNDTRISKENKEWADRILASFFGDNPRDMALNKMHAGIVDILARKVEEEYMALNLFDRSHCTDGELGEIAGKVIVISPRCLKEEYWSPENQLWLATGGFGCSPDKIGRAVYATCLYDGEESRWNRGDIIGVIKDQCMPSWAKEKMSEIENANKEDETEIQDEGMKM